MLIDHENKFKIKECKKKLKYTNKKVQKIKRVKSFEKNLRFEGDEGLEKKYNKQT